MISEYWYFGWPQLTPMNASIVTRSGTDGYSRYVVGNEGIYMLPDYIWGYTDRKYHLRFPTSHYY